MAKRSLTVISSIGKAAASPICGAVRLLPLNPIIVVSAPKVSSRNRLNRLHTGGDCRILGGASVTIIIVSKAYNIDRRSLGVARRVRGGGVPCVVMLGGYRRFARRSRELQMRRGATDCLGARGRGVLLMDTTSGDKVCRLGRRLKTLGKGRRRRQGVIKSLLRPSSFMILIIPVSDTTPGKHLVLPRRRAVQSVLSTSTSTVIIGRARLAGALTSLKGGPGVIVASDRIFKGITGSAPGSVLLASFSVLFTECGKGLRAVIHKMGTLSDLESNSGILVDRKYARRERYSSVNAIGVPH